jgi:hypothetical protein
MRLRPRSPIHAARFGIVLFAVALGVLQGVAPAAGILTVQCLPDTEVLWEGLSLGMTGSDGTMTIAEIPPGRYSVALRKAGYQELVATIILDEGAEKVIPFSQQALPASLEGLPVPAMTPPVSAPSLSAPSVSAPSVSAPPVSAPSVAQPVRSARGRAVGELSSRAQLRTKAPTAAAVPSPAGNTLRRESSREDPSGRAALAGTPPDRASILFPLALVFLCLLGAAYALSRHIGGGNLLSGLIRALAGKRMAWESRVVGVGRPVPPAHFSGWGVTGRAAYRGAEPPAVIDIDAVDVEVPDRAP